MFHMYFYPEGSGPSAGHMTSQTNRNRSQERVENAEPSHRAGREREGGFLVLVTYVNVDALFLQARKQQMPC